MSTNYPNFQNKNYYDYIQYVKENDHFFEKLRVTKSIVDDQCPESLTYFKNSGKLHKYFTYLGKIIKKTFSLNYIIKLFIFDAKLY